MPNPTKKINCSVDKGKLDLLATSLAALRGITTPDPEPETPGSRSNSRGSGRGGSKGAEQQKQVDPTDLNSILGHLIKVVTDLTVQLTTLKEGHGGDRDVGEGPALQTLREFHCKKGINLPNNWTK